MLTIVAVCLVVALLLWFADAGGAPGPVAMIRRTLDVLEPAFRAVFLRCRRAWLALRYRVEAAWLAPWD